MEKDVITAKAGIRAKGLTKYEWDISYRAMRKIRKKWAEQGINSMDDLVSEDTFRIKESYINRAFN